MLGDDQVAGYADDGFVVPDYRLAEEVLAAIRAERTLYPMRGVDRSGRNDFRVRN
jgi:hypothetical protein